MLWAGLRSRSRPESEFKTAMESEKMPNSKIYIYINILEENYLCTDRIFFNWPTSFVSKLQTLSRQNLIEIQSIKWKNLVSNIHAKNK